MIHILESHFNVSTLLPTYIKILYNRDILLYIFYAYNLTTTVTFHYKEMEWTSVYFKKNIFRQPWHQPLPMVYIINEYNSTAMLIDYLSRHFPLQMM